MLMAKKKVFSKMLAKYKVEEAVFIKLHKILQEKKGWSF